MAVGRITVRDDERRAWTPLDASPDDFDVGTRWPTRPGWTRSSCDCATTLTPAPSGNVCATCRSTLRLLDAQAAAPDRPGG